MACFSPSQCVGVTLLLTCLSNDELSFQCLSNQRILLPLLPPLTSSITMTSCFSSSCGEVSLKECPLPLALNPWWQWALGIGIASLPWAVCNTTSTCGWEAVAYRTTMCLLISHGDQALVTFPVQYEQALWHWGSLFCTGGSKLSLVASSLTQDCFTFFHSW